MKYGWCLLILFFSPTLHATSVWGWVQQSLNKNLEIKSSQLSPAIGRAKYKLILAKFLPKVSVGIEGVSTQDALFHESTRKHQARAYFQVQHSIVSPLNIFGELEIADAQEKIATWQLEQVKRRIIATTINTFMSITTASDVLKDFRKLLNSLEKLHKSSTKIYKKGLLTKSQLARTESRLLQVRAKISALQNSIASKKDFLFRVLLDHNEALPGNFTNRSTPTLNWSRSFRQFASSLDFSLAKNTSYQTAVLYQGVNQASLDMAVRSYLPDLRFKLSYGKTRAYDHGDDSSDQSQGLEASIGVNWDLFTGGSRFYNYRVNRGEVRRGALSLNQLKNTQKQRYGALLRDLDSHAEILKGQKYEFTYRLELLKNLQSKYSQGVVSAFEVDSEYQLYIQSVEAYGAGRLKYINIIGEIFQMQGHLDLYKRAGLT